MLPSPGGLAALVVQAVEVREVAAVVVDEVAREEVTAVDLLAVEDMDVVVVETGDSEEEDVEEVEKEELQEEFLEECVEVAVEVVEVVRVRALHSSSPQQLTNKVGGLEISSLERVCGSSLVCKVCHFLPQVNRNSFSAQTKGVLKDCC